MSLSKINVNDQEIIRVDTIPTKNSNGLVESSGIYDAVNIERDIEEYDFAIQDKNAKAIICSKNGHIITKNFDSSKVISEIQNNRDSDLDFTDLNNNTILSIGNGNIKTKYFDSSKVIEESQIDRNIDLDINDLNENTILSIQNGHIVTKNFNSSNLFKNKRKLIHVIGYGQSLMAGSYSGSPVSTQVKYKNLYQFAGGVRTYDLFGLDSSKRTHITRLKTEEYGEMFKTPSQNLSEYDCEILNRAYSYIIPLTETLPTYKSNSNQQIGNAYVYQNNNGGVNNLHCNGETVLTGFCEGFDEAISKGVEDYPFDFDMLASCAAYGSASYESLLPLDRGGVVNSNITNINHFETLMTQVVHGKKYADTNDLDYSVDYILYFEENTDQNNNPNPNINACRILQLFSIINSRVKGVTHQPNDIKFILPCSSIASESLTLAASIITNGNGELQLTQEEQSYIDTLVNNDIVPYSMDNVYAGVAHYGYQLSSDGVHHTSLAQKQIGYTISKNIVNNTIKPLCVNNIRVLGNDILLTYNVQSPPIVIDENAIGGVQTNADAISRGDKYGFLIRDQNGTILDIITNISVIESNIIKISCSASPLGKTIEYALSSIGNKRFGNIRDSQTTSLAQTYNWAYTFKKNL